MTGKEAIELFSSQVERLTGEHKKVVAQRNALSRECGKLREENRALLEKVKSLESELTLAQMSAGLSGNKANRDKARKRVSSMLREVSHCISLVENMRRAEQERAKQQEQARG